jgi:hypothetical protein
VNAGAMVSIVAVSAAPRRLGWLGIPIGIAVAIVLSLNPLGAVLVLGWLMRLMRRETAIAAIRELRRVNRSEALGLLASRPDLRALAPWTGWLRAAEPKSGRLGRWLGGLGETIRLGAVTALALALATLPFTALLLLSWWAGWENSFNKGYEQAWAGPALALVGIVAALFVLQHLPMAGAHLAAERRVAALFDLPTVRALIRAQRWRNLWLALLTVIAALPVAGAQILPTFVEAVQPGFAEMPPEIIAAVAARWHAVPTIYLVLVLVLLRRAQARYYARAALRLGSPRTSFVQHIAGQFGPGGVTQAAPGCGRFGGFIAGLALTAVWAAAFIAPLYVAQFANHAWWNWLNHPLIGLPWIYRPL